MHPKHSFSYYHILFFFLLGFLGYHYRYDLHIVSPRFSTGECITKVDSNGYESTRLTFLVSKMDKNKYFLKEYLTRAGFYLDFPQTRSIPDVDSDFSLTVCPEGT